MISPIIKIENGTFISGLAELATNRLLEKDFNILEPSRSQTQNLENSTMIIYKDKIDQHLLDELKDEFGIVDIQRKEDSEIPYDILIIVGKNYNATQGRKIIN